ncbi:MAG: hypothetical protein IBX63_04105 [Coriobacteriia bacterium]|nr:hypothetical protein [Coriobacteriia bacterium]
MGVHDEDQRPAPEETRGEFLKYDAPAHALGKAAEAIDRINELQAQRLIRDGVYYIVLVDLVGSTKYMAEYGNQKAAVRIQHFVASSLNALKTADLKNTAIFIKDIGDAVLLIFQHFPDVLRWRASFAEYLDVPAHQPLEIRTCVHLGEVSLEGVNPISLAVSQCFKMEKMVQASDIVLTEPAYCVAWPTLVSAHSAFEDYDAVGLDGFEEPVPLHKVLAADSRALTGLVGEGL